MQVFLSYKTEDRAFAAKLRDNLVSCDYQVWMDVYNIPSGAYWPDEIDKALRESDVVLGVLSPRSVESRNVKNEWDWAILNSKRLILILMEKCYIPMNYVSLNYIDFTSDFEITFSHLRTALDLRKTTETSADHNPKADQTAQQVNLIENLPSRESSSAKIISKTRQSVTVDIVILSSGDRYTVEIPLDSPVGLIARELISQLGLPQKFENGVQVSYDLFSKTRAAKLDSNLTFRQNDVQENDTLSFHINMVAG